MKDISKNTPLELPNGITAREFKKYFKSFRHNGLGSFIGKTTCHGYGMGLNKDEITTEIIAFLGSDEGCALITQLITGAWDYANQMGEDFDVE